MTSGLCEEPSSDASAPAPAGGHASAPTSPGLDRPPSLEPSASERERLDSLVNALDLLATVLPPGHGLLAAVCDPAGQASDLLVRGSEGETAFLLGLPDAERRAVARLFALARGDVSPPEHSPLAISPPTAPATSSSAEAARARAMLEASPVPLLLLDDHGHIEDVSASALAALGVEREAMALGFTLVSFLEPEEHRRFERLLARSSAEGTAPAFVGQLRRPGPGGERIELTMRRRDPDGGRAAGTLVALRPVTSAAVVEAAAARAAERRQRALADAVDTGVAIVSAHAQALGTVLEGNLAFGRILGTPAETIAGRSLPELAGGAEADRVAGALRSVSASGHGCRLEVLLAMTQRRVELLLEPGRSPSTAAGELIARVREVSEADDATAELSRAVTRLEQSNRELAEFAQVTAHDLAAPLRALSGLVELLQADPEDRGSGETIAAMRSALTRMQAMVDGAVGFVHAERARPSLQPVELDRVLGYARDALAADIDRTGAIVSAAPLPTVHGDPAQLERLLVSLLGNAITYAGPGTPRIRVEATRERDMWRIAVSDEGLGIEPGTEERIFRLFERVARAGAAAGGTGRGIGLATCRRIVERHGGRIWVEANEPRGSVFAFTLPAFGDPAP